MTAAADPYPPGFEPFVAAMQADTDADLPRLAFADWLDDHGDPDRAEFIRLQCRLTRWDRGGLQGTEYDLRDLLEAGDRSVADRLEKLFAANRARWLAGLPTWAVRGADWMRFQRGFIGRFQGGPKQFTGDAWAAVRRLTPLECVWVGKLTGSEEAVLGSAALVGVRELYLTNAEAAAVAALAGSPVLPSLRLLDLTGGGPPADPGTYDLLFGSPGLGGLLDLSVGGFRPGDAVAAAVAGSTCVPSLVSLTLSGTRPGAAGVARLAAASFARLTALNLRHCGIGDAGLRELVRAPLARNLQELDLGYCKLGPTAARLLAGWDGMRSVRELRLDGNALTADGLRALGTSPNAVSLAAIDLPADPMPETEWQAIRRLPVFARVADADAFAFKGGPDFD